MIYILLPLYNEANSIEPLLYRIKKGMEKRIYEYSIIIYNDGSTDNSFEILKRNVDNFPLLIIGEDDNKGIGYATSKLIDKVLKVAKENEDIAVLMDSDNTHNPEHIYSMVNKILDGYDVVIASRYLRDSRIVGVPKGRELLSLCASYLMRFLFHIKGVKDYTCGYRAYRIEILKKAKNYYGDQLIMERGFACMAELLIKLSGLNLLIAEIPLVLRYDYKNSESKMDIASTIVNTLKMLYRLKTLR